MQFSPKLILTNSSLGILILSSGHTTLILHKEYPHFLPQNIPNSKHYFLLPWESSISSSLPSSNPHWAAPIASRDPTLWFSRAKHHCHLLQESVGKSPKSQATYPIQGLVPVSLTGTLYLASHGGRAESYLDWESPEGKVLGDLSP